MKVELPPGNSTEQEYLSKAENNTKRKDKDHSSVLVTPSLKGFDQQLSTQ